MNLKEWKLFMMGHIDGVERNLSTSAPRAARAQLEELRSRVNRAVSARSRKACERRADRLTESTPYFRAACRRHIGQEADICIDGIERCIESMAGLARAQGRRRVERKIEKILRDFRKRRRKPIYRPIKPHEGGCS